MLVDLAQRPDSRAFPKLVQPPHVGHCSAIGQMGKATPSPLFGQQPHQMVERMHGGQNAQQMDAVQLGGTELRLPPPPARAGEQIVDEGIGNIWREEGQILGGARDRQ